MEIYSAGGPAKTGWSFEGISVIINGNGLSHKEVHAVAENYWELPG
jgi:hypothetical protein